MGKNEKKCDSPTQKQGGDCYKKLPTHSRNKAASVQTGFCIGYATQKPLSIFFATKPEKKRREAKNYLGNTGE